MIILLLIIIMGNKPSSNIDEIKSFLNKYNSHTKKILPKDENDKVKALINIISSGEREEIIEWCRQKKGKYLSLLALLVNTHNDKNSDFIFKIFLTGANEGDFESIDYIVDAYEKGNGTEINYGEMVNFLLKGVALKNPKSIVQLGKIYQHGKYGLDKNCLKAMELYGIAADLGNAEAAYYLAKLYERGTTKIKKSLSDAIKNFKKAYELGIIQAGNELGYIYLYGYSVTSDLTKARKYFEDVLIRSPDNIDTLCGLSMYYSKMNVKEEIKLLNKLIDLGYAKAAEPLISMYKNGVNTEGLAIEIDTVEAFKIAEKGHRLKDSYSTFYLGEAYLFGHGTEKNIKKGQEILNILII